MRTRSRRHKSIAIFGYCKWSARAQQLRPIDFWSGIFNCAFSAEYGRSLSKLVFIYILRPSIRTSICFYFPAIDAMFQRRTGVMQKGEPTLAIEWLPIGDPIRITPHQKWRKKIGIIYELHSCSTFALLRNYLLTSPFLYGQKSYENVRYLWRSFSSFILWGAK